MRVAKMPHVTWNKDRKRYEIVRRWPADVQALMPTSRFKFTFRQGVTEREANELAPEVLRKYTAEVADARERDGRAPIRESYCWPPSPWQPFGARLRDTPPPPEVLARHQLYLEAARAKITIREPVTFESLVNSWADEESKLAKARQDRSRVMRRLATYLGHDDARRVTPEHLSKYVSEVLVPDMIAGKIKAKTIRDNVINIKALFAYAKQKVRIDTNPAAELRFNGGAVAARDIASAFTAEERALILNKARDSSDPVIRWGYCLAAHMGARSAEIFEAYTHDIEVRADLGVVLFWIRLDHRPETMQVKNANSVRVVPIHSAVLAEGFLDYVKSLPPGPLFPTLPLNKHGRRNTKASDMTMDWLRNIVGITDERKRFHSWRKTVRTMLANKGCDPDRARYLIGHGAKDIDAKNYLDHEILENAKEIEKIG